MFGRIRSEFQCLERQGENSNVWKHKARIPMFGKIKSEISMLGQIRPEGQCLK